MENLCQGNQFRNFDIHAVCFQFGICAFGDDDAHEIQFCNDLILRQVVLISEGLNIFTDIHIWSDFLGLKSYNLEIWNEHVGKFSEQFLQLKLLYDETSSVVSWDPSEADEHLYDGWLQEFCDQIPDQRIRTQLEQIIKQQYQEKGMIDPTETDIV